MVQSLRSREVGVTNADFSRNFGDPSKTMKKTLAIASMVVGSLAANASNLAFSTIISSGGTQVGSGTGIFSSTLDKITLSGTFLSSSTITSGTFSGPGITTPLTFSVVANGTGAGGVKDWFFHFTSPQTVPSTFINNASSYVASFFAGVTSVASGPASAGHLTTTPEPQTYAMVAGAALLGFAAFRRARR